MQIPTWAECFVWEFWSLPMSILDDPLDVAFTIGVYTNLDGGDRSHKINWSPTYWSATSKPWIAILIC
jgi:hypothetical protein